MTAWWAKRNDDFSRDQPSVGREDLQLIGDNQFVVGVPWNFSEDFKRYVFAGAKAYCMNNRSIGYTMRTHGEHWKDFDLDVDTKLLFDSTTAVRSEVVSVLEYVKAIENKPNHHGVVAAAAAIERLQQSFAFANSAIRERLHFEANAIQCVILEQLSWCYAIATLMKVFLR